VIIAFTRTYNKFLPVGFSEWNFAFCQPFPKLFLPSTGCNRVQCFICMQVTDTAPVTCCLHGYWPPLLNRVGTNKSLSWYCRLPHCFTRFRYRDLPESFRTTRWPDPLRQFRVRFFSAVSSFFTRLAVKHNIITESFTLTWHPQQFYSTLRRTILEQGATEMQKPDNNLLWQDP